MSSEGRYPCVLYNFILGNRQQTTVGFGQAKKCLHLTPKKASLSALNQWTASYFTHSGQLSSPGVLKLAINLWS